MPATPKFGVGGAVWDGSSSSRPATGGYEPARLVDRGADANDWNQIVAEVIEIETENLDTGWVAITPGASWVNKAANSTFAYRIKGKRVFLKGVLTPSTVTDGTSIGTLDAAARPTNPATFFVPPGGTDTGEAAPPRLIVAHDGTIKTKGFTTASVSVDVGGIAFNMDN